MPVFGLIVALMMSPSATKNEAFQAGLSLYRNMEFEQALFRLQEVAVNPSVKDVDKADAFVWMGLCYAGMGNETAARQAFVDAVRKSPKVKVPKVAPPKVRQWFTEEKAKLGKSNSTTSKPPGKGKSAKQGASPATTKTSTGSPTVSQRGVSTEATTSATELELQVEQPPSETEMGTLLMLGGATTALVGIAAVAGGAFFLRDVGRLNSYITTAEGELGRTDASASTKATLQDQLNGYQQLRATDYIAGGGLVVVGLVVVASGVGLVAYGLVE